MEKAKIWTYNGLNVQAVTLNAINNWLEREINKKIFLLNIVVNRVTVLKDIQAGDFTKVLTISN